MVTDFFSPLLSTHDAVVEYKSSAVTKR